MPPGAASRLRTSATGPTWHDGTRSSFRGVPLGGSARGHRDRRRPRPAGRRLRQVGELAGGHPGGPAGGGRPGGGVRRAVRGGGRDGAGRDRRPEALGGAGGTLLDLAVALEAAAGALVPGPLLGTAVASVALGELAGPVASGEMRVALALGADGLVHDAPGATHALHVRGDEVRLVSLEQADLAPGSSPDLTRRTSIGDVSGARGDGASPTSPRNGCGRSWSRSPPPRPPGSPAGASTPQSSTPGCASSSARRSARSRRSSTSARRCSRSVSPSPPLPGTPPGSRRRRPRAARVRRVGGRDHLLRRCRLGREVLHPGARRDRVHLRARRPPLPASGAGPAQHARAHRSVRRSPGRPRRYRHPTRRPVDLADAEDGFRPEVRERAERIADLPEEDRRAALAESGYLTPHWPEPHGLGADPVQQLVIDEELARAEVSRPDLKIGAWAAPTIIDHGTEEQRKRFVGPTLTGEIQWCQLFSEPGAGSDLASLRSRAERVPATERRSGLAAHRPEGVDLAGPRGRLGDLPGPDQQRREAACGASPTSSST